MTRTPNNAAQAVLLCCATALMLVLPASSRTAPAASQQALPASAGDPWSACFSGCSWPCASARYSGDVEVSEQTEAACQAQSGGDAAAFDTCVVDAYVVACYDSCSDTCAYLLEGDSGFEY